MQVFLVRVELSRITKVSGGMKRAERPLRIVINVGDYKS